jgi:hypothetical protein
MEKNSHCKENCTNAVNLLKYINKISLSNVELKNIIEDCEKHCINTKTTSQSDYSYISTISEGLGIIIGEKYNTKLPKD